MEAVTSPAPLLQILADFLLFLEKIHIFLKNLLFEYVSLVILSSGKSGNGLTQLPRAHTGLGWGWSFLGPAPGLERATLSSVCLEYVPHAHCLPNTQPFFLEQSPQIT